MATQTSTIREAIEQVNERFMDAYNRGDAQGIADLYTTDGELMAPNFEVMKGKEAIQHLWQGAMDMGIKSVKMDIREVEQHGDIAYEVSRASLYGDGGEVLDEANYLVIWKREGGDWKLHRDIFNSSRPAK